MKTRKASFVQPVIMLTAFLLFTLLVAMVDFKPIGPRGSEVGLAAINGFLHSYFGYNDLFYVLSKILGYICFLIPVINAGVALRDIYRKKSLFKIGPDVLGAFCIYVLMAFFYVLFNTVVLNYRPVVMDGELEASYPSSHTLLAVTLSLSAALQLNFRDRNLERKARNQKILIALGLLVVVTRFFSGVHWFTDIVGGVLLGLTLAALYVPLVRFIGRLFYKDKKKAKKAVRKPRQGHTGPAAKSAEKHELKEAAAAEKEEKAPEAGPAEEPQAPEKEEALVQTSPEPEKEDPAPQEKASAPAEEAVKEEPLKEEPLKEEPVKEASAEEEKKEVPEE